MIAIDTSSLQRLFAGVRAVDTEAALEALKKGEAVLPPPVLSEALSDPALTGENEKRLKEIAVLPIQTGFWERAGLLRRSLLALDLRAKLPDVLIAQSCIDHDVPLITYDRDFRHFSRAGLKLA